jgi:hypothetical protein
LPSMTSTSYHQLEIAPSHVWHSSELSRRRDQGIKNTSKKISEGKGVIDLHDLRRALKQKPKTGDPDIDGISTDDEDDQFDVNGALARAGVSNWH